MIAVFDRNLQLKRVWCSALALCMVEILFLESCSCICLGVLVIGLKLLVNFLVLLLYIGGFSSFCLVNWEKL